MPTSISDLRAANPYKNQSYNKSGWQKFLSSLGFRTEADAWQENMAVQAAEYDAALLQKEYDTAYDSASAQVSRLKQAGLNPDLDPSMVDAGSAGAMGDDPSVPMQSTGEEHVISDAVGYIIDAVSMGIGLSKSFGELKSLGLTNDERQLVNSDKAVQFAKSIGSLIRRPMDANLSDNERDVQNTRVASSVSRGLKIPKRLRRTFNSGLIQFFGSLDEQADYWSKTRSSNSDKQSVARQLDSRFFGEGTIESMKVVNEGLVELSDLAAEASLRRQGAEDNYSAQKVEGLDPALAADVENAENAYKKEYFDSASGAAVGAAENAEADLSSQTAHVTKAINSSLAKITHKLEKLANNGDILAQSLLFSFALARMSSVSFSPKGFGFSLNK